MKRLNKNPELAKRLISSVSKIRTDDCDDVSLALKRIQVLQFCIGMISIKYDNDFF